MSNCYGWVQYVNVHLHCIGLYSGSSGFIVCLPDSFGFVKKSFAKLQTKKNSFEVLKEFLNINTEVCERRQRMEEESKPCPPLQPQHKRKT